MGTRREVYEREMQGGVAVALSFASELGAQQAAVQ